MLDDDELYPARHYAKLINSLYYREYDPELGASVIEMTRNIDINRLLQDPSSFFDVVSMAYRIELNLEAYRELGAREGSLVSASHAIEDASRVGGEIYKTLEQKVRAFVP